jgi:hypothetical protein
MLRQVRRYRTFDFFTMIGASGTLVTLEQESRRARNCEAETDMGRLGTWLFYVALALAVATLWLYFEGPHYHLAV